MNIESISTFGQLKAAGYKSKSIKEELRDNLIAHLKKGTTVFEGIHGYENSVIPEVERAILSGHNINFLGLRGQAKTRIARLMVELLDEYIPALQGTELWEDPFRPISAEAKEILEKHGDEAPIFWIHRSERYAEKLATPDVTVADLIGDVDPIKAANLRLSYAHEKVIHFGMIPRAHRGIFVINELPDLQARIQVALFNILQEGDVQIRGFKLRLPLDIQFVFTANPEDYTNRGSIVTPLKDRIGSQILTHYPEDIDTARKITEQEAELRKAQRQKVLIPEAAYLLLEQISFEARENEFIDAKSGVSARLTISALENLVSSAERRCLISHSETTVLRLQDFMGIIPSVTGKVELVYEGEQEGSAVVAENLISEAIKTLTPEFFPPMDKLKRTDEQNPYQELIDWFGNQSIDLLDDFSESEYRKALDHIKPLKKLVEKHQPDLSEPEQYFMMEWVLWALAKHSRLSQEKLKTGINFSDLFSSYLKGGSLEI